MGVVLLAGLCRRAGPGLCSPLLLDPWGQGVWLHGVTGCTLPRSWAGPLLGFAQVAVPQHGVDGARECASGVGVASVQAPWSGLQTLPHHCTGSLAGLLPRPDLRLFSRRAGLKAQRRWRGLCRLWLLSLLVVQGLSQCSPVVLGCWHDSLPGWIVSCAPRLQASVARLPGGEIWGLCA